MGAKIMGFTRERDVEKSERAATFLPLRAYIAWLFDEVIDLPLSCPDRLYGGGGGRWDALNSVSGLFALQNIPVRLEGAKCI